MNDRQLDTGPPGVSIQDKLPAYQFGPADWQKYLGVSVPGGLSEPSWKPEILDLPSPEHEIQEVRQTHFAFCGLDQANNEAVNLLFWEKSFPDKVTFALASLAEMNFAKRPLSNSWSLSLIGALPESEGKSFSAQVNTIPEGYQVTSAIEEVSKYLLYWVKYGKMPEIESRIRCFDIGQSGYNVVVQVLKNRIMIDSLPSDQSQEDLGVGVSVKTQFKS
jgi:hypothetical protein